MSGRSTLRFCVLLLLFTIIASDYGYAHSFKKRPEASTLAKQFSPRTLEKLSEAKSLGNSPSEQARSILSKLSAQTKRFVQKSTSVGKSLNTPRNLVEHGDHTDMMAGWNGDIMWSELSSDCTALLESGGLVPEQMNAHDYEPAWSQELSECSDEIEWVYDMSLRSLNGFKKLKGGQSGGDKGNGMMGSDSDMLSSDSDNMSSDSDKMSSDKKGDCKEMFTNYACDAGGMNLIPMMFLDETCSEAAISSNGLVPVGTCMEMEEGGTWAPSCVDGVPMFNMFSDSSCSMPSTEASFSMASPFCVSGGCMEDAPESNCDTERRVSYVCSEDQTMMHLLGFAGDNCLGDGMDMGSVPVGTCNIDDKDGAGWMANCENGTAIYVSYADTMCQGEPTSSTPYASMDPINGNCFLSGCVEDEGPTSAYCLKSCQTAASEFILGVSAHCGVSAVNWLQKEMCSGDMMMGTNNSMSSGQAPSGAPDMGDDMMPSSGPAGEEMMMNDDVAMCQMALVSHMGVFVTMSELVLWSDTGCTSGSSGYCMDEYFWSVGDDEEEDDHNQEMGDQGPMGSDGHMGSDGAMGSDEMAGSDMECSVWPPTCETINEDQMCAAVSADPTNCCFGSYLAAAAVNEMLSCPYKTMMTDMGMIPACSLTVLDQLCATTEPTSLTSQYSSQMTTCCELPSDPTVCSETQAAADKVNDMITTMTNAAWAGITHSPTMSGDSNEATAGATSTAPTRSPTTTPTVAPTKPPTVIVSFESNFADLVISEPALRTEFETEYKSDIASKYADSGITTANVEITEIVYGSVLVKSKVVFETAEKSAAFVSDANLGDIFTPAFNTSYGAPVISQIATATGPPADSLVTVSPTVSVSPTVNLTEAASMRLEVSLFATIFAIFAFLY